METVHIQKRFIKPSDLPFLRKLYESTRSQELKLIPHWNEDEKKAFLDQQFHAQHTYYKENFGEAEFSLLLVNDIPVGRLYLDRRKDELRIIDIALLPAYRGIGIGTKLLREILKEAHNVEKPVRIHVEQNNPALSLYSRLGFRQIGDTGVYYLMEWNSEN